VPQIARTHVDVATNNQAATSGFDIVYVSLPFSTQLASNVLTPAQKKLQL
jgi:hypothetical protein